MRLEEERLKAEKEKNPVMEVSDESSSDEDTHSRHLNDGILSPDDPNYFAKLCK